MNRDDQLFCRRAGGGDHIRVEAKVPQFDVDVIHMGEKFPKKFNALVFAQTFLTSFLGVTNRENFWEPQMF
jgi:hypothetical protein